MKISKNKSLLSILAVSFILRIILIFNGGQYFWGDEARHDTCVSMMRYLLEGNLFRFVKYFNSCPEHTGGYVFGLIPASLQIAVARIFSVSTESILWVPSIIYAAASVASIALVYAVAIRARAERREALIAAFLMACSTTMLYYSRHYVSYDFSICIGLSALLVGLRDKGGIKQDILFGFLVSFAFLTYNGFFFQSIMLVFVYALLGRGVAEKVRRAVVPLFCIVFIPVLFTIITELLGATRPYIYGILYKLSFPTTNGDPAEGWKLPFEYFWHAEGLLTFIWLAAILVVFYKLATRRITLKSRGALWLIIVVGIYAMIAFGSTGMGFNFARGRTCRQIAPYISLLSASAIYGWPWKRWITNKALVLGGVIIAAIAVANFYIPFAIRFPKDILNKLNRQYGEISTWSVINNEELTSKMHYADSDYVLLNGMFLTKPMNKFRERPDGEVIMSFLHPFQFYPYQYELFTESERKLIREKDIAIRLIKLKQKQ